MRDIHKVIDRLLEVIPETETVVRTQVKDVSNRASYHPPESRSQDWYRLAIVLQTNIGDPVGEEWKERVGRIVRGEEEVS